MSFRRLVGTYSEIFQMSDVNSLDQVQNLINRSTVLIKLSLSKVAFILKVRKLKMFSDLPLPYSQQNQAVSSYGR